VSIESLNVLKKILGRLPRSEFSAHDYPLDRLMDLISAPEHEFKPDIEVTDAGVEMPIAGFVYSIKAKDSDLKYNIDREVTATDYDVAWRDTITIISRLGTKIYAKAPAGQVGKLWVKALKIGA